MPVATLGSGPNAIGVLPGLPVKALRELIALAREIALVLKMDEVHRRLAADGAEVEYLGPAAFAKFVAAESSKWGKVVTQAGLKPQ